MIGTEKGKRGDKKEKIEKRRKIEEKKVIIFWTSEHNVWHSTNNVLIPNHSGLKAWRYHTQLHRAS
jgi:hypothetical protein